MDDRRLGQEWRFPECDDWVVRVTACPTGYRWRVRDDRLRTAGQRYEAADWFHRTFRPQDTLEASYTALWAHRSPFTAD